VGRGEGSEPLAHPGLGGMQLAVSGNNTCVCSRSVRLGANMGVHLSRARQVQP
jgi:hypothetical protein